MALEYLTQVLERFSFQVLVGDCFSRDDAKERLLTVILHPALHKSGRGRNSPPRPAAGGAGGSANVVPESDGLHRA